MSTDALFAAAMDHHQAGRLAQAEILYSQIIALEPDHAQARHYLGVAAHQLGRTDAIALLRRALALRPDEAVYHQNLGLALEFRGQLAEAAQCYERATTLLPGYAEAHHSLGKAVFRLGRQGAVPMIRRAIALQPRVPVYHCDLGYMLYEEGDIRGAARCGENALAIQPDNVDGHFLLGLSHLVEGDFVRGLAEFEWRYKKPIYAPMLAALRQPLWRGDDLAGRTLLLYSEQGFGDAMQFVRYVPQFAARLPQARFIVLCQPAIFSLVARYLSGICPVVPDVPAEPYQAVYGLGSLPFFFGTTLDSIPGDTGYLAPLPEAVVRWRGRLADDACPRKVGLVWAGSSIHGNDRNRSMPLATLALLGGVAGVSFYSLQEGAAARQTADCPGLKLTDFSGEWQSFDDTAALVANLDLVITVDTAVAHLAGAMGKPVWVLLAFVPDWRWLLGREDSPWYPTLRLFRQRAAGDWAEVVGRVARALGEWR